MSALLILAAALITFLLRAAFMLGAAPSWEERAEPYLQRFGAAVLPVLALSLLLGQAEHPQADARYIAAACACLTTLVLRRSVLVPLLIGFGMVWFLAR